MASDVSARELIDKAIPQSQQQGILALCALNQLMPPKQVRKEWSVGRYRVVYQHRSKDNLMGRFGGGWNWEVGVQVGRSTVIVNLLVASLRFSKKRPEAARGE